MEPVDPTQPGRQPIQVPGWRLGPGRDAFSKRTRGVMGGLLGVFVVVVVVVGAIALRSSKHTPVRSVTIPVADRGAAPALLRAAEAVGFTPNTIAGGGQIESRPASAADPKSASGLLPVGAAAPPFKLATPTGKQVSLADYRGKAVLLEFFATWCPHCAAEAPHLIKIYAGLPHASYGFVSVNADGEDAASVLAYHIYFGFPFPALLDPSARPGTFHHPGGLGPVAQRYKVGYYPTFYVLDRNGKIVWRGHGEQPDAVLRNALRGASG